MPQSLPKPLPWQCLVWSIGTTEVLRRRENVPPWILTVKFYLLLIITMSLTIK